jgi:hypothetical protein
MSTRRSAEPVYTVSDPTIARYARLAAGASDPAVADAWRTKITERVDVLRERGHLRPETNGDRL